MKKKKPEIKPFKQPKKFTPGFIIKEYEETGVQTNLIETEDESAQIMRDLYQAQKDYPYKKCYRRFYFNEKGISHAI